MSTTKIVIKKSSKRRGMSKGNKELLQNEITRSIKWSHFVQYTAAGLSVQTYRLNSLYDPDETGAGTQPVGFDEIMALYYYFKVERVKVKITVVNGGTAAISAVTLSNSATDPSQITAMACNNSSKAEMCAGTYGFNRSVFVYDVNIREWLGFQSLEAADLKGTAAANPARIVFMHIGMEELDLSAKDISLFCQFEFETRFTNPIQLDNS